MRKIDTHRIIDTKWETPVCNNCEQNNCTTVLDNITSWEAKGVFTIVKCKRCGLIYLNPRPTIKEIGKYYPTESYWGADITKDTNTLSISDEREKTFHPIYAAIFSRYKNKGTILDIGAGTGTFLSKFKDLNWQVDGVEFSKEAVSYARKTFGVPLRTGDLFDHIFPKDTYDVVTMNMALEHLYNPKKALHEIHKIMKNDGLLVITVPNMSSVGFQLFKKNWQALQLPRHLYHFTDAVLKEMVTDAGFHVIKINHWYWVHNYYIMFQSFRFSMSPRFKKTKQGGLSSPNYKKRFSFKIALGKIVIASLVALIVIYGSTIQRSEAITLYAVKN